MSSPTGNKELPQRDELAAFLQLLENLFANMHPEISPKERKDITLSIVKQCFKEPQFNFKNLLSNLADKKHQLVLGMLFQVFLAKERGHQLDTNLDNVMKFFLMSPEALNLELKNNPKFLQNVSKDLHSLKMELRILHPQEAQKLDAVMDGFDQLVELEEKPEKENKAEVKTPSTQADEVDELFLEICNNCGFDPRGFSFLNIFSGLRNAALVRPFSIGAQGDLESAPERMAEMGKDQVEDSPLELLQLVNRQLDELRHTQVQESALHAEKNIDPQTSHKSPYEIPKCKPDGY